MTPAELELGMGHMTDFEPEVRDGTRDSRRTRSGAGHVNPTYRKWPVQRHLGSQGAPSRSGVNEPNGDNLRRSRRGTCVVGKVTCSPGVVQVTPAEQEVGDGSRDTCRTRREGHYT